MNSVSNQSPYQSSWSTQVHKPCLSTTVLTPSKPLSDNADGFHRPTPPSASLTVLSAASRNSASAASSTSAETAPSSFLIPQGLRAQPSRADNTETPLERLLVVQDAIKWVIENQHKLLDKMERVMSNQLRVEERLETLRMSVLRLSEALDDWKRKTESEGSMEACND